MKDRSEGETIHFKFLPLYVKCIIVPRLGCRLARPRQDRRSHNESLGVVRIKGSLVTMAQTTKHNEARAGQVACLQHLYPPLVTRARDRTVSSTIDYRNSSIAPEISINLGLSNKLRFFFPFICFLLWELGFSVKAHEFTYPVCNPSINWKMWGSLWKLQCGEESWHTHTLLFFLVIGW